MSSSSDEPRPSGVEPASNGRLDSWKEIASYLRRSVRSAKRWEKEEGLPIHRHLHGKRDSVYAYGTELDVWWNSRGLKLSDQNGAEEPELPLEPKLGEVLPSPPRTRRRAALIGVGFALAILLVGAVAWLSRTGPAPPTGSLRPLPFQARDWVLVADFENRTGEKVFDGTLDYALGRELSNSRFVNVVPRERIGDALRLMRKPPDTGLDASTAREVCLRDGEIRAFLTGRVEKLGAKYLLSVEVMEPKRGAIVAGFSEEAPGIDDALTSLRRLSDRVRERLGETLPARDDGRPPVRVTTSNLRALQLYSQADSLMANHGSQAAAEELLRRAVAEDPSFASAYIHLAWAISNQGRPREDYLAHAETAVRLSETTTDPERYFIRGSHFWFIGQQEKAISAYETLISLNPDHGWAANNLASLYLSHVSEYSELPLSLKNAVPFLARAADLRPKDFKANLIAGYFLVVWSRDPTRAAPYLRRASDLITPEVEEDWGFNIGCMKILPFTEAWLRGDVATAASELDRVATKVDSLTGEARNELAVMIAQGYLTLGKIEAAERASEKIPDPVLRNDTLAELSFLKGDQLALTQRLKLRGDLGGGEFPMWWEPIAMFQVRAGLISEAGRFHKHFEEHALRRPVPVRRDRPELHEIPGEMALSRGDLARAISELEKATTLFGDFGGNGSGNQLSFESLATALRKKGDLPRAIQVLERASERKYEAVIDGATGAYWMRNRFELARLYRTVGRVEEARAIEADLTRLLALAEANHPILLELQRLAKS